MRLRSLFRLYKIYRTALHYELDELAAETPVASKLKILLYLTPAYWFRKPREESIGQRIRLTLEELGPIFIKFGQVLSTRRDLLPLEIADELAKLQDNAPPFPGEQAQAILEAEYGRPLSSVFAEFDINPLAAASVAQVHAARLPNDRDVVVKIIRPNVEIRIQQDVEVLYLIASLVESLWDEGRRLHPTEVVKEFDQILQDEIDMMREAGNCSLLRRNFENSRLLYVPEVEW
ncbi:MAG: AarF/UbiB family protein, partial [Pseudomonadota bacterium]